MGREFVNQSEIKKVFHKVSKWVFIPSSFLLIIFLVFTKVIITRTFGVQFESAYKAIWILCTGHFLYNLFCLGGALLIAMGETKRYFFADLCGVLVSFALFPFLVKYSGFTGAAYVTLIRLIVVNGIWMISVYRISKLVPVDFGIMFSFQG